MFYEELKQIIRSVLQQGLSGQSLMEVLTAKVDPTKICESDEMLVTVARKCSKLLRGISWWSSG